ncbi:MAG TPA: hypothetical protein VG652_07720 [Gaiellaceae bacterium]|nr:hypothetical protein [Gaiellaceae bacterium]
MSGEPWEVFKESYNEPLLFLKHQDDKINRVLTALAFLTAAGVALYISAGSSGHGLPQFSNSYVATGDYFFGCFIIGLFFAVSLAIVALDPTSFTPRFVDKPAPPESVLFYGSIASWTKSDWENMTLEVFKTALASSFHKDAHRLSHRAIHKVRRFGQANAFVQFTIVSLALLGVMRLNHVHIENRWAVATTLLIIYTLFPAIDFVYFRGLNFPGVGADYTPPDIAARAALWGKGIVFFVPFFVVSTLGLALAHSNWQPVTYSLFGTVVIRLLALFQWQLMGSHQWVIPIAAAVVLAGGGALWLWGCS